MPLDASGVTPIFAARTTAEGAVQEKPTLDYGPDIGVALRHAREWRGMSIDDVAEETKVRRAYIAAIEDMRLDQLPSRPFTIGYVKSYAELMGFEPGAAIARFKEASPDPDNKLREPIGVPQERDPRLGLIAVAGAVILAAIITWNVAQRVITAAEAPPDQTLDIQSFAPAGPAGPVSLGAPLPAPPESTVPAPYLTPGLEAPAQPTFDPTRPGVNPSAVAATNAQPLSMPATFTPHGAVFGAPPASSVVTIQAREPSNLVVRGADGAVYFARQMAPGEAFRAPLLNGMRFETSNPIGFDVYVRGQAKGQLAASITDVASLVPPPASAPAQPAAAPAKTAG
ncbi:MAG: helix-turn-helix domain-containing protein [Ignavibacteriales bacterium]